MRAGRVQHAVDSPFCNRADLSRSNGEKVTGHAEGRSMEVADGLDASVCGHHRVVDRGAHLVVGDSRRVGPRVTSRPVHLGGTTQRVGVLHSRVVVAV